MSVKRMIHETDGIFFITITCYSWISLLQITNTYDAVYKCPSDPFIRAEFDWLKKEGHYVAGYVIMPNHIHALIAFSKTKKNTNINKIIGNGKRFLAYEIIDRLKEASNVSLLKKLSDAVEITDRKRGKLHEVYEDSFDIKECLTQKFIKQKLDYIPARRVIQAGITIHVQENARPTFSSGRRCLPIARKNMCIVLPTFILRVSKGFTPSLMLKSCWILI